jgi:hypothetical protein
MNLNIKMQYQEENLMFRICFFFENKFIAIISFQ